MNEKITILKYFSTCSDESMRDKHEKRFLFWMNRFFTSRSGKNIKNVYFFFSTSKNMDLIDGNEMSQKS